MFLAYFQLSTKTEAVQRLEHQVQEGQSKALQRTAELSKLEERMREVTSEIAGLKSQEKTLRNSVST